MARQGGALPLARGHFNTLKGLVMFFQTPAVTPSSFVGTSFSFSLFNMQIHFTAAGEDLQLRITRVPSH